MIVDTSVNYLTWPNSLTIAYLSKTVELPPTLGVTTSLIPYVLWTASKKARLVSNGIYVKYDRAFRFARAVAGSIIPKEGDIAVEHRSCVTALGQLDADVRAILIASGVRWKVEEIEILSYGEEFRCHCTKSAKQGVQVGA